MPLIHYNSPLGNLLEYKCLKYIYNQQGMDHILHNQLCYKFQGHKLLVLLNLQHSSNLMCILYSDPFQQHYSIQLDK